MGAKQRADAETLKTKYANTFGVPKEKVEIKFLEDDNAIIFHKTDKLLPRWSLK